MRKSNNGDMKKERASFLKLLVISSYEFIDNITNNAHKLSNNELLWNKIFFCLCCS